MSDVHENFYFLFAVGSYSWKHLRCPFPEQQSVHLLYDAHWRLWKYSYRTDISRNQTKLCHIWSIISTKIPALVQLGKEKQQIWGKKKFSKVSFSPYHKHVEPTALEVPRRPTAASSGSLPHYSLSLGANSTNSCLDCQSPPHFLCCTSEFSRKPTCVCSHIRPQLEQETFLTMMFPNLHSTLLPNELKSCLGMSKYRSH